MEVILFFKTMIYTDVLKQHPVLVFVKQNRIFVWYQITQIMTTVIINENTEEGRSLMNIIRSIRKSSDAIVDIYNEKQGSFPIMMNEDAVMTEVTLEKDYLERIPGLPRTQEEQIASVKEAMNDIRAGRVVTIEEMRAKHPRI